MYRITLEWYEGTRRVTRTICDEDLTIIPDSIRLGRADETQCDIILKNPDPQIILTVSKLHAEIVFDHNTNNFFIQNLTANRPQPNPVIVNGTKLLQGKVKLTKGSVIELGKITLKVKGLQLPEVASVYTVSCSGPQRHILEKKYESLNCPYCGYIVFNGTIIKR